MPIHHDILAKPDNCAGRDGNRHRSGEYKNRSVQHTADNHIPQLRAAIRRQLQNKGGRHTAQYSFAQQEGSQQRNTDGKHNQKEHEAACGNRISPCEEEARKKNQRWETPIAGNEAVREDGNQAFSGGFDDAAGCDPCGIAAKAHAHCQCLLPMCACLPEQPIEIKGDARQKPKILKQGKQREKNRHGRQHDRHNPAEREPDSI